MTVAIVLLRNGVASYFELIMSALYICIYLILLQIILIT